MWQRMLQLGSGSTPKEIALTPNSASASTVLDSTHSAWKAFDNDNSTYWMTVDNPSTTSYIMCDFGSAVTVKRFTMIPFYVSGYGMSFCSGATLKGSNTGNINDFVPIKSYTFDNNLNIDESVDNNIGFRYYMFDNIATNDKSSYKNRGIFSIQFYGYE